MAENPVIHGKLSCGYAFEIPRHRLDNMELVDALAELGENPLMLSRVVSIILPDDEKKKLYDFLRGEDGIVSSGAVGDAISEILSAGSAKNS